MMTKLMKFLPMLLLLAFVAPPVSTAYANAADVKIRLAAGPGFAGAKGSAKYRDRGGEREFQVEAEVPRRLAGSVLTVTVDSVVVGRMTINNFGVGRLSLNSTLGQPVPRVVSGSLVGVTTANGQIVLAGQF